MYASMWGRVRGWKGLEDHTNEFGLSLEGNQLP